MYGSLEPRFNGIPRIVKIQHFQVNLKFDFPSNTVLGKARIFFNPTQLTGTITLSAYFFDEIHVFLSDTTTPLTFRYDNRKLQVQLPEIVTSDTPFSITINYKAQPKAGLYFQKNHATPEFWYITSCGEGGLHCNWLPIYIYEDMKFTTEVLISVPKGYTAISNGHLISCKTDTEGLVVWHWKHNFPHSSYLLAIYVGDYQSVKLDTANPSLTVWAPKGKIKEGSYSFRNTRRMLTFFEDFLGVPYPWDCYDQIASPDYAGGALEHTTKTGHSSTVLRLESDGSPLDHYLPNFDEYSTDWTAEAVISHELAHQWFGDLVTCRNLAYIWLNEGFATYFMMLWTGELYGNDDLLFAVESARSHYLEYSKGVERPLEFHEFTCAEDAFDVAHAYLKGGIVICSLHRLLGSDFFRKGVSIYLKKFALGLVTSEDLQYSLEEASGLDLKPFFSNWVKSAGHPCLNLVYQYSKRYKKITIKIIQEQTNQLFTLPIELTIATQALTRKIPIILSGKEHIYSIECSEEPKFIHLDSSGVFLLEINSNQSLDAFISQVTLDELPSRIYAMNQIAKNFSNDEAAVQAFQVLLRDPFWGIRAEAAMRISELSNPAALDLLLEGLLDPDYRVRKSAVIGLRKFPSTRTKIALDKVIETEANKDVVATAIVSRSRIDPSLDESFFVSQMKRTSWNDEIIISCICAIMSETRHDLLRYVTLFVNPNYNEHLRKAAFSAWVALDGEDPDLHELLIAQVNTTPYMIKMFAIETIGDLAISKAKPALECLIREHADPSIFESAKHALNKIIALETAQILHFDN